jgi:alpha-amylase
LDTPVDLTLLLQYPDRTEETSEPYEIEAWVGFDFPGRGDKYSSQKYRWEHFSGTDYDAKTKKRGIFKIVGENKGWSNSVDNESGNADFLMFADIDYSHPEVQKNVKNWMGCQGMQLVWI